jgi:hypothetical protein
MVGKGNNIKSMGYVFNLTHFFSDLLNFGSGKFVYNYAGKPDLKTDKILMITSTALGKSLR